ncbi:MAG: hypothetical protein ACR2LL_08290 [Nitrosopumilus sp.]
MQYSHSVLVSQSYSSSRMMAQNSSPIQLDKQEEIIRLISDQCARRIIDSIQAESKSAAQISSELDTELSVVYRRLQKFQKYNLLKTTFQITADGEKSFYYQSKINGVIAKYQQGGFDVSLSFHPM